MPGSLRDRIHAWRVRLIADPRFQRWATAFPFTRPIATRKARQLFDLCAGFVYSQVLSAVVRLKLLEALADGPKPLAALAASAGLDENRARRLLRAADGLDLISDRGGEIYALGDLGAAVLGNAGVAEMIRHHATLYADLRDPVGLLSGAVADTEMAKYWPYADGEGLDSMDAGQVADYSRLMAASQPMIAEDVLDAYDVSRHRQLMDVGGGAGGFAIAAAGRAPELQIRLVDLPQVAEIARANMEAAGLGPRAQAIGHDFHRDTLPEGADLVSLIRVCFDHADDTVVALLRAIRAVIAPGGTLILAEPMAGSPRPDPIGDAYFGFYLLAMGRGRCRRPEELIALIETAGFRGARRRATRRPMLAGLITATAD
jgi:demethylspheroidene O-methyltransferase